MSKLRVNGVTLHYVTVGRGPDIVMLHGFLGNQAIWHLYVAPMLRREFRVTTYDLRGHGYSDVTPTGYTTASMAEDLRCFLDELEIERPILIGHNFGADVAMYFALLYPERVPKLLAIEPGFAVLVPLGPDKAGIGWTAWIAKLKEGGIQGAKSKRTDTGNVRQLIPKIYGPAPSLPRQCAPLLSLIHNTTLLKDYEEVGAMTLDAVRTIHTPTLLVYSRKSQFINSYHVLHEALPNCQSVLLPGGEQFGALEQPELLSVHLMRFLQWPPAVRRVSRDVADAGATGSRPRRR